MDIKTQRRLIKKAAIEAAKTADAMFCGDMTFGRAYYDKAARDLNKARENWIKTHIGEDPAAFTEANKPPRKFKVITILSRKRRLRLEARNAPKVCKVREARYDIVFRDKKRHVIKIVEDIRASRLEGVIITTIFDMPKGIKYTLYKK